VTHSEIIRLLEKSYSPEDWQYLTQNKTFKEHLDADDGSLENYESLVDIGSLLLRQRDDLNKMQS